MKARIWNHRFWVGTTDVQVLLNLFKETLKLAGFHVVGFTESHFQPHGYTAVWLLAESHFALHTFPEEARAYCELSSCNRLMFATFVELVEPHEIG